MTAGALFSTGAASAANSPTINTVTLSGGAGTSTVGGFYARTGAPLTLAVTTSSDTQCVDVSGGGFSGHDSNGSGKASWSFTATAPAGPDGQQVITVLATPSANSTKCTAGGQGTSQTKAYVLDNTGPVVTGAVAPTPNAAGWNKSNVTVTWSATDAGSGVASGPTPATSTRTTDGQVSLSSSATDRLDNSATGSVTVNLDKSNPTIIGSRSPAADSFGWNNTSVSVSFSCADNPASQASGLAAPGCPTATTVSTDGTNQSVTGSVSDVAGNTSSNTVSGINIDRVNPTLSGAPTTSPNGNGWYKSNVVIHWTAGDLLSGVDPATAPGDAVLSSEGLNLTASASVSDKAGNTVSATSSAVKIDKTPPITGLTGASNNWTNGNVTLTLSPSDALSGVASTTYSVDGGSAQSGASLTLSAEGVHTVTYSSTDKAGNVEATRSVDVRIDKTAPTISHVFVSPSGYSDGGWTNSNVTVRFTCADAGSGVASCTPDHVVSTQGAGQQVTGSGVDNAGNSASDTATVNIDKTPPTISAAADRPGNGNGWYSDDVTVSYLCADQAHLSGILSCTPSQLFGQGADQTASGTATDIAGNVTTASIAGINVDKTAPSLAGAPTTSPNAHGWYDNSVVVAWTCSDGLSGIDGPCPANSTVDGEGNNLSATTSVYDKAGNVRTVTVGGIKIDTTAPTTTASVSDPLATGWYADRAHITLTAVDNLAGIEATYYSVDGGAPQIYGGAFNFSTPGVHTITFWSVDRAGNAENATGPGQTVTVKVDNIKPGISGSADPAPNAAGWNNRDVTVVFDCTDAESGIASCTGGTTLTNDAANQYVTGTATDNGGNSDTATVGPINIDETAPSLAGVPTTSPNANGWYQADVAVHWTASDGTSGVDEATVPDDTVLTGQGGDLTAGPVSVRDIAGNIGNASVQHIKIDRTAPTISGTPTTSPDADGWYSGDVMIHWTCADALSGIGIGDCPADSTISGEGDNLSASASVSDRAGNSGSATVDGIHIDTTAPSTDIAAPSGWHNTDATVTLSANDNLSGVAATHYTVNNGPVQTGTTVAFTAEGTYDLEAWSVDKAGNVEAHKTARVLIDKTAPTITHSQSPAANGDGWNNTDVKITFECDDTGGSGLASCTAPITENHEGKDQPEPGTAVDNAGNSETDPATVSIDKSDPTISGAPDRAPNDNGWYADDVTVTFTCDDQLLLSGIKACPEPVTLGEGAGQSASGTAVDAAGNRARATVGGIDADETAPELSGAPIADPNADGWYNDDVTIHWTCSDALSGIDGGCPADSTITGEGSHLGAATGAGDLAGNVTNASVTGIQIDRAAPATAVVLPPADSDNGWYGSAPTVSLTASDALSGVKKTWYRIDGGAPVQYTVPFVEALEGVHTVTFWSADKAGNTESAAGSDNTATIRVDSTNPDITGSRLPAANADGWNNEPVVVSFSCTDSGSGIATCTPATTLDAQGANQSVIGEAVDKVGNHSSTTVGNLRIDLTAPSLSGAPTTSPNAAGWYNDDVTVHWSCSDDLSGIAGACPADSTVTGEGDDLATSTSVSDKAGNNTPAAVTGIKIDRTGPVTSLTAPSDWLRNGVTLDVESFDNLSGVAATHYTVNGEPTQTGDKIVLSDDGTYAVTFWSVDKAGNEGTHGSATVRIDKTAPTISHTIAPQPNGTGWNNSDSTVHFVCYDATSGLARCTEDKVVTSEAADQKVVGTAVDNAGNSSSDTATVNLDETKPTITGAPDRAPNANGWYDANVLVSFTCGDSLSGIASCTGNQTVSEGAAQSVSGTAIDLAGNTRSATVSNLNVDETDPILSGTVTSPPNGNDWYSGDVNVHWTCSDALSGIAGGCPPDSTVTGEGDNLSVTASVTDKAGNQTTRTVSGIHIDRTAPVTTASVPSSTYASGWYDGPVTVTLSGSDNLSGVARTYYSVDGGPPSDYSAPFQAGKGTHTVMYWSKDGAGNVEDKTAAGHSVTIKVDDRSPTITGAPTTSANANGWYNANVVVHFQCSDVETAVSDCSADKTISAEGANQFASGTAKDAAGNMATVQVGPLNVDKTAPHFAAYTGPTSFTLGQSIIAPTCQASDALSGLASCSLVKTGSALTNPNGVGDVIYTFTAADKAGNSNTNAITLHIGYQWSGFLQPVTNTAHDLGSASSFKAGSTVPVKFQLKNAAGNSVSAAYMPAWLQPVDLGTSATMTTAQSGSAPATVGGSFKSDGSGQYVFTWQTPKTGAGHYYRIGVQLDSGDVYTTLIVLQ